MDGIGTEDAARRTHHGWAGSWSAMVAIVLLVTVVRVVNTVWLSPLNLAEDEAYYLEWSRSLDWSYFSKGPGVAYAIAASVGLFGISDWAVRLPTILAAAIGALASGVLGRRVFGDWRVGTLSAGLYLLLPGFQVSASFMTIDGPYLACWSVACLLGWLAIVERRGWAWPMLGLSLAAAFLFKYAALLLLPGLVWSALVMRRQVSDDGRRIGVWSIVSCVVLACCGLVPVVIYNASRGWPTLAHQLEHLGVGVERPAAPSGAGGDGVRSVVELVGAVGSALLDRLLWVLEYAGSQVALAGGLVGLVVAGVLASRAVARGNAALCGGLDALLDRGRRREGLGYLLAGAVPMFGFYLLVCLVTQAEWNWAMAGWVSLCPLGAMACIAGARAIGGSRAPAAGAVPAPVLQMVAFGLGAVVMVGLVAMPWAARLGDATGLYHLPLQRASGFRAYADDVAGILDELERETGLEPFVLANHWGRTAQLARYLPAGVTGGGDPRAPAGRPDVYSVTRFTASRGQRAESQYDLWAHTDLQDAATVQWLAGRPAYLSGSEPGFWQRAFERVEALDVEVAGEKSILPSDPKSNRASYVGYGFRGFGGGSGSAAGSGG